MEYLVLGRFRLPRGGRARVMGVVNATPDSFFDRGRYYDPRDPGPAIARAEVLLAEGADLIDVGGETAQPTSPVLDVEEETRRVVPVISGLARRSSVPISVDTYKPAVARAAMDAGASLINDTSGLADPELARVAQETGAGIVVMHIPCHPKQRLQPGYPDVVQAIGTFLAEKVATIERAGVPRDRIIVDPGIGFGKTPEENLELIANVGELRALGLPILFACSRRTFLGDLMGGEPPEERLEATVAVNAHAISAGAELVRVHDVRFHAKLARMLELVKARAHAR